jgi:hypothetical protein
MTGDLVTLEVRFLLARYGLRRVVEALAKVRGQSAEQIEADLERLETASAGREEKPKESLRRLLARLGAKSPEQASMIRELVELYKQGRFLPSLRMAEDFVAGRTGQRPRFKSRRAALPTLLDVIVTIPPEQLGGLRDEWAFTPSSGDYELLARAIIGSK